MTGFFTGRTLADLGRDLRAGRTSAAALLDRALESIDPGLNAFVTVDAAGAAEAARRADEELAAGADRGPLHGVPVAVKDIIDVEGLPTGMGSALFDGHVATGDAACVRRLREAGAVIVGKTTTHEFAYGASGDVSVTGPSRNPHDPARISGGSSGGSAVAVAAGMVPLALGTDTGGSVRIPAALCGITGFKPAFGAIPVDGVFPLAKSLDHVGVLAAAPADCRTAYRVLTASDDRPAPAEIRMAWIDGMAPVDEQVERTVRAALAGLPAERLDLPAARRIFAAIQDSETYDLHADRVEREPDRFQPATLDRLRRAARTPGWRYVRAMRERDAFAGAVADLLARYDVLVLPTVPLTAPPIGERDTVLGPLQPVLVSLTCPWNVARVPALSVPAGSVDGLPVGAQFIGRPGAEHVLFAAAERFRASRGRADALHR
ncbi:amidohydrolase [Actinomadura sp. NBRC 104425]|uniref:amidase n=1 Tax=Actinomadura sp. NBRC 104425 TaxID=3032204 RepID=UPI0024A5535F|nr:amidase [Actinomadura sp. NBRC 104425]GLZ10136.1 amidohydrolase [Actinomadura sp. NBRC 104425]